MTLQRAALWAIVVAAQEWRVMGRVYAEEDGKPQVIEPEAVNSDNARSSELAGAMERLNPRQQRVLTERFGLKDGKPKTLEEIGRRLGLTRERVRQIELDSLRRLAGQHEMQAVHS